MALSGCAQFSSLMFLWIPFLTSVCSLTTDSSWPTTNSSLTPESTHSPPPPTPSPITCDITIDTLYDPFLTSPPSPSRFNFGDSNKTLSATCNCSAECDNIVFAYNDTLGRTLREIPTVPATHTPTSKVSTAKAMIHPNETGFKVTYYCYCTNKTETATEYQTKGRGFHLASLSVCIASCQTCPSKPAKSEETSFTSPSTHKVCVEDEGQPVSSDYEALENSKKITWKFNGTHPNSTEVKCDELPKAYLKVTSNGKTLAPKNLHYYDIVAIDPQNKTILRLKNCSDVSTESVSNGILGSCSKGWDLSVVNNSGFAAFSNWKEFIRLDITFRGLRLHLGFLLVRTVVMKDAKGNCQSPEWLNATEDPMYSCKKQETPKTVEVCFPTRKSITFYDISHVPTTTPAPSTKTTTTSSRIPGSGKTPSPSPSPTAEPKGKISVALLAILLTLMLVAVVEYILVCWVYGVRIYGFGLVMVYHSENKEDVEKMKKMASMPAFENRPADEYPIGVSVEGTEKGQTIAHEQMKHFIKTPEVYMFPEDQMEVMDDIQMIQNPKDSDLPLKWNANYGDYFVPGEDDDFEALQTMLSWAAHIIFDIQGHDSLRGKMIKDLTPRKDYTEPFSVLDTMFDTQIQSIAPPLDTKLHSISAGNPSSR